MLSQLYNNLNCPILDIGDRQGMTGYIDFITPDELIIDKYRQPINKGIDIYGRKFIVFKALLEYDENHLQIETFTTIFQRYADSDLWVGAGKHDYLFETSGGINSHQIQLLTELLQRDVNVFHLTNETITNCRICCYGLLKPINILLRKI